MGQKIRPEHITRPSLGDSNVTILEILKILMIVEGDEETSALSRYRTIVSVVMSALLALYCHVGGGGERRLYRDAQE